MYKRSPVDDPEFDVRAFRWANLTSGSRWTALWLLLAPFALANAAGWMAGWVREPRAAAAKPGDDDGLRKTGRWLVRWAGGMLTCVLVCQALTVVVVLPLLWAGSTGLEPFGLRISDVDQRLLLTTVIALAFGAYYVLVGVVSARTHFTSAQKKAWQVVFSKKAMQSTAESSISDETQETRRKEDPGAAWMGDDRMWTVHPMLHRLRRIHFGLGVLTMATFVVSVTRTGLTAMLLLILTGLALVFALATTIWPQSRLVWSSTSLFPLLSCIVLIAAVVSVWVGSLDWQLAESGHVQFGITYGFGIATVGSFLFAGPLSAGALVIGTFIGVTMGATAALSVDRVLGTEFIRTGGTDWVAGAIVIFLGILLLAVVALAFVGNARDEDGGTSPLPSGFRNAMMVVARRVEIHAPVVFWAAALTGVVFFIATTFFAWAEGAKKALEGDPLGPWARLVAGFDPTALPAFPPYLVVIGISSVVLPVGYFAFRSVWRGFGGGKSGVERRRQVGVLWDLGSFWARWYHPLAPPGYGPNAVRSLTSWIKELPSGSLVGAHSQGALIAAVALFRAKREKEVAFITYGAQLGILYPRMFPLVGIPNLVQDVAAGTHGWSNLWRQTDFIGGHFIDDDRVRNKFVDEDSGHSRYEITREYRCARRQLFGLDLPEECR